MPKWNFIYTHNKVRRPSWADFHVTHNCSVAFCAYRIAPKSGSDCGKYGYQFVYAHMWSMAFTAPIFVKLRIRQGISVDMFCAELYSNWTKLWKTVKF